MVGDSVILRVHMATISPWDPRGGQQLLSTSRIRRVFVFLAVCRTACCSGDLLQMRARPTAADLGPRGGRQADEFIKLVAERKPTMM